MKLANILRCEPLGVVEWGEKEQVDIGSIDM